ncbi:hypothetical protein M378DRAFT_862932 [Amanita muscaria Koide BX008]|uniref:Lipoyl-binding domain-containing protein n=1 Tax=Amanita muscaria (strain Koide BX008) TaxID=946122 RepID=A0A0C2SDR4_AMAMK|nr:hypothetical protein M378DRAFT_862932 [Amanita muscaria Koide BX008]
MNIGPKSTVQIFDPLCEVQSDKASVEITSPCDGVVKVMILAIEEQVAKSCVSLNPRKKLQVLLTCPSRPNLLRKSLHHSKAGSGRDSTEGETVTPS